MVSRDSESPREVQEGKIPQQKSGRDHDRDSRKRLRESGSWVQLRGPIEKTKKKNTLF